MTIRIASSSKLMLVRQSRKEACFSSSLMFALHWGPSLKLRVPIQSQPTARGFTMALLQKRWRVAAHSPNGPSTRKHERRGSSTNAWHDCGHGRRRLCDDRGRRRLTTPPQTAQAVRASIATKQKKIVRTSASPCLRLPPERARARQVSPIGPE